MGYLLVFKVERRKLVGFKVYRRIVNFPSIKGRSGIFPNFRVCKTIYIYIYVCMYILLKVVHKKIDTKQNNSNKQKTSPIKLCVK